MWILLINTACVYIIGTQGLEARGAVELKKCMGQSLVKVCDSRCKLW